MLRKTTRAEGPIAPRTLDLRSAHEGGFVFMGSWEPEVGMRGGLLTLFSQRTKRSRI
jgi:hypothetical protein